MLGQIDPGSGLQDLLERTSDVSDAVRKQAFSVLANKCRMGNLSKPQRALVLRQGLRDRSPGVLEAARTLAQTWLLEDCQADVLKLLHELDVEAFAGRCFSSIGRGWCHRDIRS